MRIAAPAAAADLFATYAAQFVPALQERRAEVPALAALIGHLALLTRMGRVEAIILAAVAGIALLNWCVVRGQKPAVPASGDITG
jgi:hypothetical protein